MNPTNGNEPGSPAGAAVYQNTPEAFQAQLREGHYNELRVALFYMLAGFHVRIGFREGRYDLELTRPGQTIRHLEVKWDKRAESTGNLYFEVENTRQKRPSGVMSTKADLWCHVVGEQGTALLARTAELREFLLDGAFKSVHTRGIDSNSRGVLVPRNAIEKDGFRWVRLPTVEEYFGELFRRHGRES